MDSVFHVFKMGFWWVQSGFHGDNFVLDIFQRFDGIYRVFRCFCFDWIRL